MSKKKKTPKTKSKTTDTRTREIFKVLWKDHYSGNYGWTHIEDMNHEPHINVTVGIKVHEDDEHLVLAANMCSENKGSDTTSIIKNCIVKRECLGEVQFGKA